MADRASDTTDSISRFRRLLLVSHEAAGVGEYEVAYHALLAALHQAEFMGSLEGVHQVAEATDVQSSAIEALIPPHHLSSAMAKRRGTSPVYDSLRLHAKAVRSRLEKANTHPAVAPGG